MLSFHAAVLDRIESGLANWGDNFSEIECFNTQNQHLCLLSTRLAAGTTLLGPVIIAVSGIAPKRAAILPISKVWSTSARIASCPLTPLVHAPPGHCLLTPVDYPAQPIPFPLQLLHPFLRPAVFHLPFRCLPP